MLFNSSAFNHIFKKRQKNRENIYLNYLLSHIVHLRIPLSTY